MNDSEKILSAFAKLYFFDELVHDTLNFTPEGSSEKEVADLLLNLGDIIVAIQLKWRNDECASDKVATEIKWLGSQCKEAKKQVKQSIEFIRSGELPPFPNRRAQSFRINADAKIVPLVVFMNERIEHYAPVLKKHSDQGMDINCMSFTDFQKMCEVLISPIEIVDYLEWRLQFYKTMVPADFLLCNTPENMITITRPTNRESLVYQYLVETYGLQQSQEWEMYAEKFRGFLHQLPQHTVVQSENTADCEIIRFFSHFNRQEISLVVDRLLLTRGKAHNKEYGICGSLTNTRQRYLVVFVSSDQGRGFPMEYLLNATLHRDKI